MLRTVPPSIHHLHTHNEKEQIITVANTDTITMITTLVIPLEYVL